MSSPSQPDASCTLRLLLDGGDDPAALTEQIRETLDEARLEVEVAFEPAARNAVVARITGAERAVNNAHQKLTAKLAQSGSLVVLHDEAGDALRARAYPVLADLELRLRRFIVQAMIETIGFDWWERVGASRVTARVDELGRRTRDFGLHHPIESTDFDHLIELVTANLAAWQPDQPLTPRDLAELLDESASLDDVKRNLARKTDQRTFWDEVFAARFTDDESWKAARVRLRKEVIPLRNKVMHHRTVFWWEVEAAERTAAELRALLDAGQKRMTAPEREQTERSARELAGIAEGTTLRRAELQERFGSSLQSGISVPRDYPAVFLFTRSDGPFPGGRDAFLKDGTFLYYGEGQRGDMQLTRGNLAIANHRQNGRALHLFEHTHPGHVRYLGEAFYKGHKFVIEPDITGVPRTAILFELEMMPDAPPADESG